MCKEEQIDLNRDCSTDLVILEDMHQHDHDQLKKEYHTVNQQITHSKLVQRQRRKWQEFKQKQLWADVFM